MPIPAVLLPLLKGLAANGLSTLATAIAAKGKEVVEQTIGVKIPDDPANLDPPTLLALRQATMDHEEKLREFTVRELELQLADAQAEHKETQETIRAGDRAEDPFVRRTRPGQSWVSLFAALAYVFTADSIDPTILGLLLTLPWAYAGLRQIGKGVDTIASARAKA